MLGFKARHQVLVFPVVKTLDAVLVAIIIGYRQNDRARPSTRTNARTNTRTNSRAGGFIDIDYKLVLKFRVIGASYSRGTSTALHVKSRVYHQSVVMIKCRFAALLGCFTIQSPRVAVSGILCVPCSYIRYGEVNLYCLDIAAIYAEACAMYR